MNAVFLEKILGRRFFVVLNLLIILVVESTGKFFYNTGMLHVIALLFVLLTVVRIFIHYKTFDQFLDKIVHASIFALFIFAISHIMEYINFTLYHRYDDAVFATTINFYLIGLASIAIGAELFLVKYDKRSNLLLQFLYLISVGLAVFNIAISFNHSLVSLDLGTVFPYLYTLLAAGLLIVAVKKILRLRQKISISVGFLNFLIWSMSFIAISMAPNIFYETLEEKFGLMMYQIMYLSHFAFFVSLSLMFLSYRKLANLSGVYAQAQQLNNSVSGSNQSL